MELPGRLQSQQAHGDEATFSTTARVPVPANALRAERFHCRSIAQLAFTLGISKDPSIGSIPQEPAGARVPVGMGSHGGCRSLWASGARESSRVLGRTSRLSGFRGF